jgi:uncharacterized protein (DUF169 family)
MVPVILRKQRKDVDMSELPSTLHKALKTYGQFPTLPVGVKLAKENDKAPKKAKYPLSDIGNRIALCQGLTIARTIGWTMAFKKKDNACPLSTVFLGHIKPDKLLEGKVAGFYQDDEECAKLMEKSFPRWPIDTIQEIWLSPLQTCEFEPDAAIVYGNSAQILTLIHAANFRKGSGIASSSNGRGGCSSWIAGAVQSGECTYLIPGPGERVFAGTQDYEVSFVIPYPKFENLIDGLKYIRKKGAFRYPVPNLAVLSEPKFPEEYYALDPSWKDRSTVK